MSCSPSVARHRTLNRVVWMQDENVFMNVDVVDVQAGRGRSCAGSPRTRIQGTSILAPEVRARARASSQTTSAAPNPDRDDVSCNLNNTVHTGCDDEKGFADTDAISHDSTNNATNITMNSGGGINGNIGSVAHSSKATFRTAHQHSFRDRLSVSNAMAEHRREELQRLQLQQGKMRYLQENAHKMRNRIGDQELTIAELQREIR